MNLFVYGCLLAPEVVERVTGRSFRSEEGVLHGYMGLRLKRSPDAALVPFPDTQVEGLVYFDVDGESLRRIDVFQGPDFKREEINVQTGSDQWAEAETHVFKLRERRRLTAKSWDETEFREKHLARLLQSRNLGSRASRTTSQSA